MRAPRRSRSFSCFPLRLMSKIEVGRASRCRTPKLQIMLVASPRNQSNRHEEVACFGRPLAVSGRAQHPRQVALQRHLQLFAVGFEQDRLESREWLPQRPCGSPRSLTRNKGSRPSRDRRRPCAGAGARASRAHSARRKVGFPGLERQELVFDRQRGDAVLDRLNELADLPFEGGELGARARKARALPYS